VRLTDADHNISAVFYDAASGGYVGSTRVSFVGGFSATLLPRTYKVSLFPINYNTPPGMDSLAVLYYEHGKRFSDPAATTVEPGQDTFLALNDCLMERASGGIAGLVYNRETGGLMTSGTYLIFAFDEEGRPAASSGYLDYEGLVTGSYLLKGLWPGQYHVLAVASESERSFGAAQWYDQIDVDLESVMNVPMPSVPPTAIPVSVGSGVTAGIDFHLGRTTDVTRDPPPGVPEACVLDQNYPNPFNPSTTIRFALPARTHVTLTVFNTLGQQVMTLVEAEMEAGCHEAMLNATHLASGVYLSRLRTDGFVQTRKLVILR
jgi:hypothetical protein